jgi:phosphorylcholine metabolism protein LicD
MIKDNAVKNLFDYADTLESLGITFWLDGGTLLGAYRDRDFCEDDHTDIDLFTWGNYDYLIPEILRINTEKGFELKNYWRGDVKAKDHGQEIAMARSEGKVDLNFFEKKKETAWSCIYKRPRDENGFSECTPQITPVKFYEELQLYEFYGRKFNIPRDIEGYLTYRYGDWRTKIKHKEYSCYNIDQLRALKKDFIYYE